MNKQYLRHVIVLVAIAIVCMFAGISFRHWGFEAIAVILLLFGYILLFVFPESKQSNGTKVPLQNPETIEKKEE
jgi:hypothetical protein